MDFNSIEQFAAAGFNRFSLGVQDFDDKLLKRLNRDTSRIPVAELALKIKSVNASLNLDFIYGLPGQTVESFLRTIEQAVEISPDRLVAFSYAHVPWFKKHQLALEKLGLIPAGIKTEMFVSAHNMLAESGYKPIGLDHFVLPSDDLYLSLAEGTLHRNFQGYCTRRTTGQVYAFGITAISQLEEGYSQNTRDIDEYIETVNRGLLPVERGCVLSGDQIMTRNAITALMCNNRLSLAEAPKTLYVDEQALDRLAADGLIEWSGKTMEVTEHGAFFIRNIAAAFDMDYIPDNSVHSKTV
jgi:oxygen-independent coproporphyrinogen-3 oxidase